MERRQSTLPSATMRGNPKKGNEPTVGGQEPKQMTRAESDLPRKKPGRAKQISSKENLAHKKKTAPK